MNENIFRVTDELCPLCFSRKNAAGACPIHGANPDLTVRAPFLNLGTVVGNRYVVGESRGKNGDGITYVAFDSVRGAKCSLREFYPETLCQRGLDRTNVEFSPLKAEISDDCRDRFVALWTKLRELSDLGSVITVYDVLLDHGTVCAVYENTETKTVRDYLLEFEGGYISWDQARVLFMPVLSSLKALHAEGIIHRGISPTTLLIGSDGRLKLSGFSILQARCASGELKSELFPGYSPIEQYDLSYRQGPWSDIYSFAAVLYRALIGSQPIDSPTRAMNDKLMIPARFAEQIPAYVINALINALQILPSERTGSIEQFRAELSASPGAVEAVPENAIPYTPPKTEDSVKIFVPGADIASSAVSGEHEPPEPPRRPDPDEDGRKSGAALKVVLVLLIAIILVGGGAFAWFYFSGKEEPTTTEAPTTTQAQLITVPGFVGVPYQTVLDNGWADRLKIEMSEAPSSTVSAGYVISQSVQEGTSVEFGSTIVLVVSSGPETFEMPDVLDMTLAKAQEILGAKALNIETSTKYNDGTHVAGTVAETLPAAGTVITVGDTVTVVVWADVETTTEEPTTIAPVPLTIIDDEDDATTTEEADEPSDEESVQP